MSEPSLTLSADAMGAEDDLPRTVRRERDARERAQREREAASAAGLSQGPSLRVAPGGGFGPQPMAAPQPLRSLDDDLDLPAPPATVTAFDVPFWRLSLFLLKAVVAGIPALLLLGAILYGIGQALQTFFPWLVKLKILISIPH
ncbi:MAG: hypothetical protein NW223_05395 [Hyphomicrobiaceae bacterium]|nr:hypothetical protein [Hyphomicrobiaceae bacterium]